MKLRVFLCHASDDKLMVRELYKKLVLERWIDAWLDEEKLLPGQKWKIEIPKAVRTADVVIVCLSTKSVSKEGYVQRELKYALDTALEKPEETIFIIPLRLDNCSVPESIKELHWVNLFSSVDKIAYEQLKKSLMLRAASLGISTGVVRGTSFKQSQKKNNQPIEFAAPLAPYVSRISADPSPTIVMLTATPNPVPAGDGLGETMITWSTGNGLTGQVYVTTNNGAEQLFAHNPWGAQLADWIQDNVLYEFRLYAGKTRTKLLKSLIVKRSLLKSK